MAERIAHAVASHFGISMNRLTKPRSRAAEDVKPRWFAAAIAKDACGISMEELGKILSMHHSGALHADKTVKAFCELYPRFAKEFSEVKTSVLKAVSAR